MDITAVFIDVNTSDPAVVAQAVADFMNYHRDSLTPEEATAIYEQMYSYGVPRAVVAAAGSGFPSVTG